MKTPFVHYVVEADKNIESEEKPVWDRVRVSGVVRDTPRKLGIIFQQNQQLLPCSRLVFARYDPIWI